MITMEALNEEGFGFYYVEVSVTGGQTSDYVKLPYNAQSSVAIYPNNRAKVQYTLSSIDKLEAGTADWIDWPLGSINRNDSDTIVGVATSVRLVSDNGVARMEVLAR